VSITTSDPSVATVQPNVTFTADAEIGPENTKQVTIAYVAQGTAAISFTASSPGGNFDGVIWSNGVVAASRPGFTLSTNDLVIPYDGQASFTVTPDTVPTADTHLTIASTQPAKAAPVQMAIVFRAGTVVTQTIDVKSWCSVSPGNCARAGAAIITLTSSSVGGNYDGVDSTSVVTAEVQPPRLSLSTSSLLVQASAGAAGNQDTVVRVESLDSAVATVSATVVLPMGAVAPVAVSVGWGGVGVTQLRATVPDDGSGISQSNFVGIDPILVPVRSMAGFTLSSGTVALQPGVQFPLTIAPSLEISAELTVSVSLSPPGIATVAPSTLTFAPPRQLIGLAVPVTVGLRVVLSEGSQRFPRVGPGTITALLSDNLDEVSVAWDSRAGQPDEALPVGLGGVFSLALLEDITLSVTQGRAASAPRAPPP